MAEFLLPISRWLLLSKKSPFHNRKILFSGKIDTVLVIYDDLEVNNNQIVNITKKLNSIASNIDYLRILPGNNLDTKKTKFSLNENQLTLDGKPKKSADINNLSSQYDIIINVTKNSSPKLELFLLRITSDIKVTFNKKYLKFYNLILPTEKEEITNKLDTFIQIYQSIQR